jgi:two-component system CheB/CheR fusion protein
MQKKGALRPNFIVGVGGSAGGLSAYKKLLDTLPFHTGITFVVIAHLMPMANSQLVQILSRHTKMPVILAANSLPIQANHVYVIPPDSDLYIDKDTFKVVSPRSVRNKQVDLFFISLSEAIGARAIGIILSGYDGDGSAGCIHIKAKGGTTFAQDNSAEVNHMPLNAEATGCVDFVLPVEKISYELIKMVRAASGKKKKRKPRPNIS